MKRLRACVPILLALGGCYRSDAETWKQKYVKELELHQQTQTIKQAEVAARDLEAENQREMMAILAEQIKDLEKANERLRDELNQLKAQRRGPVPPCNGTVTGVAGEIGLVVINLGRDQQLIEGDEFEITRDGQQIARIKLDRVDGKWSAGKVTGNQGSPQKGDTATLIQK